MADNTTNKVIIVAVDGSEASSSAINWAANAALKRGEPLKLVSAYTMPQFLYADGMVPPQELYTEMEQEAQRKVDEAVEQVKAFSADIECSTLVKETGPIDLLLQLSESATMIVMGSRGLGGLSGLVMGSVSAAVVSHAECPVVVVRKDNEVNDSNKYGPVVVGVDGSEASRKALDMAFQEADARGVTLRAIHAWRDNQFSASYVGVVEAQVNLDTVIQEHQDLLSAEVGKLLEKYPNVKVEEVVERERPVNSLKDAADDAQLLVVGSHGRGGFRGMLLGSTSRALLQYAPCPMMVVRQ